jgi:TetR/AcrR family transcriptional repressor of bet genes
VAEQRPKFTREEPETRRADLIAATARCLAESGVAGTSVREVAARAGVSPGLIRHYFGGIDRLVLETYRHVGDKVSRAVDAAVAGAGDDPEARLDAFLAANFAPPILDADLLSTWLAFWSLVQRDADVRAVHAEIYAANRRQLEAHLLAVAEKRGGAVDARLVAVGITALVDGLWLELCLDPSTFSAEEAIGIVRGAVQAGLG